MDTLLPSLPLLAAFLAAAMVLAVTPGPGVLYIVTRTLSQGRASGFASVAGVALGNLGNAAAASAGLAALLASSATLFQVVRYAGAAYLFYLGVQALRQGRAATSASATQASHWQDLKQGALVALLNPKTTLFFAAFLPQFMQPTSAPVLQALSLSAIFVGVAAISDCAYVLAAAAIYPALRASPKRVGLGRYAAALVYFLLAIYAAVAGSRPGRA